MGLLVLRATGGAAPTSAPTSTPHSSCQAVLALGVLLLATAACSTKDASLSQPTAVAVTGQPGARPCEPGEGDQAACFDPDAARAANKTFRDRVVPAPSDLAQAAAAVPRVRTALAGLERPTSVAQVTGALNAAGLNGYGVPADQAFGLPAGSTGVSVEFGSACVHGHVDDQQVVLQTAGVTNEGSCLPSLGGQ